jgi:hypothetical protein
MVRWVISLGEFGFFVCDRDLEDELIRALGTDAVEVRSQRKEHYARLMVAELDLARMPPALDAVLQFV